MPIETTSQSYPIVGMFFHQPAPLLVQVLTIGAPLIVMAEPTNNYDPNAIAVWMPTASLSDAALAQLEADLPGCGMDLEGLKAETMWHLGYIPKALAAALKESGAVAEDIDIEAEFSLSPNGKPRVRFDVPLRDKDLGDSAT